RLDNPPQPQTVQSVQPSEARPPLPSSSGSQATTPSPSVLPPEVKYEAALLDLRNASATRTVEPANPDPSENTQKIPRGLLALTVQLPIGSDNGSYEVQIRDSNQEPIRTTKGQATIENGIAKLSINLDTRVIQPGQYGFAWRLEDFSWR